MDSNRNIKKEENSKFCVLIILVTQITFGFTMGVNLTALNSSTPAIRVFINDSYVFRYSTPIPGWTAKLVLTLAQSLLVWGSLAGAILVHSVFKLFSRNGAMLLVHVINLMSAILMGPTASYAHSYEALIVGRFINGISRGMGFSIVGVIVAELTCRRKLGSFQGPFSYIIFISAAFGVGIGHSEVLGTPDLWMWIMCIPAVPSLFYCSIYSWIPQTPGFLARSGKSEEAWKSLRMLRSGDDADVSEELERIEIQIKEDSHLHAVPIRKLLKNRHYTWQLFTAMMVMNSSQLLGIQAIFFYSNTLLLHAGVPEESVTFVSMAIFLECIVAGCIAILLHKRIGTKKTFLIGVFITLLSFILFIIATSLHYLTSAMYYVSIAGMLLIQLGMGIGPHFATFALTSELTTQTTRPTVIFYSGCMFWVVAGLTSFIFPYSLAAWGVFAYIPFIIIAALLMVFGAFAVPETHQKSVSEIQESFRKKSQRSNKTLQSSENPAYEEEATT